MKLNLNSWYNKLYMFMYDIESYQMPKDGCKYLRNMLWLLITLPFSWVVSWILFIMKENTSLGNKIMLTCAWYILTMIGTGFYDNVENDILRNVLIVTAPIFFVGTIFIAGFIVYFFLDKLPKMLRRKVPYGGRKPSIISQFFKSIKEKYCIRIQWEKE